MSNKEEKRRQLDNTLKQFGGMNIFQLYLMKSSNTLKAIGEHVDYKRIRASFMEISPQERQDLEDELNNILNGPKNQHEETERKQEN